MQPHHSTFDVDVTSLLTGATPLMGGEGTDLVPEVPNLAPVRGQYCPPRGDRTGPCHFAILLLREQIAIGPWESN